MKLFSILLFLVLVLQPKVSLDSSSIVHQKNTLDTIEFSPNKHFKGHCDGLCNVYVGGTSTVKTINGSSLQKGVSINLFVKCPTKIRLQKGKTYKFTAEKFKLNSCSTIVDSTVNLKRYCLIDEIK